VVKKIDEKNEYKEIFFKEIKIISEKLKLAIKKNQTIIFRYHKDCDGITAILSIYNALKNSSGYDNFKNCEFNSSISPYYSVADALKDHQSFNFKQRFAPVGMKQLLVLIDIGSTPEEKKAVLFMKNLGYEVIIIDHHPPLKEEINEIKNEEIIHLNPYFKNLDSNVTAGLLSFLIANEIYPQKRNYLLPAISLVGDKSNLEIQDYYFQKTNYSKEKIIQIAKGLDYYAFTLKFNHGIEVFNDYFDLDFINKEFIEGIQKLNQIQLKITQPHVQLKELSKDIVFAQIQLDELNTLVYPSAGRITGLLFENVKEIHKNKKILFVSFLQNRIIFRATEKIFVLDDMIVNLNSHFINSHIEGGGHDCAGVFNFYNLSKEELINFILSKL
jgi:RecJ-like exonuclease